MLCFCNKWSIGFFLRTILFFSIALEDCMSLRAQTRDIYSDSIRKLSHRDTLFANNDRLHVLNNSHIATIYNDWAKMESDKGNYQYASDLYNKALKLRPLNDNSQYLLLNNFCELYLRRGMYSNAKDILGVLVPSSHEQRFAYYSNLSSYYLYVNQLDSAKNALTYLYQMAVSVEEKSNVALNLSYLYFQQGNYKASYDILNKELNGTKDNNRKYIMLSHKAVVESHLGYIQDAVKDIDSCLTWQKKNLGISHQDYLISLRKKAEILKEGDDYANAATLFMQYIRAEKKYATQNFAYFSEQQRLDYWHNKKQLLSEVFSLEYDNKQFLDSLYDVALFRRQVALLGRKDSLTISQKLSYTKNMIAKNLGKKDIAIEFIKYEKDKKNRYAALLLAGSDKKQVKFIPLWLEDSIKAYNVGGNRLDLALCSKIKEDKDRVYQNESLSSFIWDKLLPFIPEGSIVYFAPDGILHLLAIEYLPTVNNGKYELHRLTTTALLAEQKNKRKKQKTNSLVIGGMDYDFIPPLDNETSAIANKDAFEYLLQNNKLMHFTYLPGSKAETDTIVNYLSHIDGFEDIDESLLKDRMGRYNIVHLATHGYSWYVDVPSLPYAYRDSITEDKSLQASGIAISGANRLYLYPHRDDGLLSARELCEMDLTGVELVVASACQSAQGRVCDEGPIGLVRGLKKAGVKTIIASLWPVNDNSTTLLMQFFYDEWREGKGKNSKGCSKAHALHLAQERLRNVEGPPARIRTYNSSTKTGRYKTATTTTYDSPYYWAPFIIIDDI